MANASIERVGSSVGIADQLLRARSVRVIAGGRLAIAVFTLGAVWLDPAQPAQAPRLTYGLLALYAFAAAIFFHIQRRNSLSWVPANPHLHLLDLFAHVLEMGLFTFLLYATDGLTSPFFPLFTFSILSATFRWGWKGALWTSVAVLLLLIVSAVIHLKVGSISLFEIDRFLIRCGHVIVVGTMMLYFGFHQQRLQGEMLRLGGWSSDTFESVQLAEYLATNAAYAAGVFDGSRIALAAHDPDEPLAICIRQEAGSVRRDRLMPPNLDLVIPESGDMCFMGHRSAPEIIVLSQAGELSSIPAPDSFRRLCALFDADHLLSAPVRSRLFAGRLLVLDQPNLSAEEMMVASLVARQVERGLDRMEALDALSRAAAGEERLKMARDLHDGVLQTLAATAMHLEALGRSSTLDLKRIKNLQEWLRSEQRELRGMIERLRTHDSAEANDPEVAGGSDLANLITRLERQWEIKIRLSRNLPELSLDQKMVFQVRQIIREAVANAVRHGGANELTVKLAREGGQLNIQIADNGTGLGLKGDFDGEQCRRQGLGPRNLRDRVTASRGRFQLQSSSDGLRIEMWLPLEQETHP